MSRSEVREMLLNGAFGGRGAVAVLERLEAIERELLEGYTSVRDAQSGTWVQVPLDSTRVAALKAAADLLWRRIDKVVPTLKAIELTGEEGAPLAGELPDKLVLATKLMALLRDTREQVKPEPEHDFLR